MTRRNGRRYDYSKRIDIFVLKQREVRVVAVGATQSVAYVLHNRESATLAHTGGSARVAKAKENSNLNAPMHVGVTTLQLPVDEHVAVVQLG